MQTFKEKLVEIIKANPGKASFDLKCFTGEKLTSSLTSKMASTLRTLVDSGEITRTLIDHTRPYLGYHFWFNDDRIPPAPAAPSERSTKAQEKVDFVLNLVETKPGITSSRVGQLFAVNNYGDKNTARTILTKLLADKLVQRRAIQAGNPGAGFCYWAADATPTFLAAAETARKAALVPQRKSINLATKPAQNEPVAQFDEPVTSSTTTVDTSTANIEIAIRLCEIEAYRNPGRFAEFMACADNIRKTLQKAA